MSTRKTSGPVDRYKPELLLLAPESGEDANTLSLIAQLIELGVPIELDANWRIPTAPTKKLSAYKACLFPETARAKYNNALNSFYRRGGYLAWCKYFPIGRGTGGVHHFFESYGRDVYFWTIANVMLEGGLTTNNRNFARTLEQRPVDSMIAECRAAYFAQFGARKIEKWTNWGDPAYTNLVANAVLADKLLDAEWLDLVNYCLGKLSDAASEATTSALSETKELVGTADIDLPMMAAVLFDRGTKSGRADWIESGVKLVRHFADNNDLLVGVPSPPYMRYLWSETLLPLAGLYWAHRVTGEKRFLRLADIMVRTVAARNHRRDGLWWHWTDPKVPGKKGASWSRAMYWALLFMTESLKALDPASASAAFLRREIVKSFEALRKYQDRQFGIWHLVMDDPHTRVESSASAGILYCYDRLREMGVLDKGYESMMQRAFLGLKRLYYRGGLAAACRGTATGVDSYYRTRPMGWYNHGLFPATLAIRR